VANGFSLFALTKGFPEEKGLDDVLLEFVLVTSPAWNVGVGVKTLVSIFTISDIILEPF
jgi:hypothetical protein